LFKYTFFFQEQFYKEHEAHICSKFKNKLRTNPLCSSLKFSIKVLNKTTASAAQLAKCILLHAYLCKTAAPSCMRTQTKTLYSLLNKLA